LIHIIGIGYKDIGQKALDICICSDAIITSHRLYERFKVYDFYKTVNDKIIVINNVNQTLQYLDNNKDKLIVLLASGDALFHGIAKRVIKEVGKEFVTIHPELSAIQVAFARIKESWDDAFLMSLHGGLINGKHRAYVVEDVPNILDANQKVAILTDNINNPVTIAKALLKSNHHDATMYVCQRLGYEDEEITIDTPSGISQTSFKEPNVVIIKKSEDINSNPKSNKSNLYVTEAGLLHKEGMITKDEIRGVIIHKLELPQDGIFWDIGAGSGAVSIDIAIRYPKLRIYAIEQDITQCRYVIENIKKYEVTNITIMNMKAPEGLRQLPSPDRVFIGGSGGQLKNILEIINEKGSESLITIVSATMIETLNEALQYFQQLDFKTDCSQINIARLVNISRGHYFKALNPVLIIKAYR